MFGLVWGSNSSSFIGCSIWFVWFWSWFDCLNSFHYAYCFNCYLLTLCYSFRLPCLISMLFRYLRSAITLDRFLRYNYQTVYLVFYFCYYLMINVQSLLMKLILNFLSFFIIYFFSILIYIVILFNLLTLGCFLLYYRQLMQ
jgi:hypothetical protein